MDGSRGAKNTPRPKVGPVVNRPGARKYPDKPADPTAPTAVSKVPEQPKAAARPAAGARSGKPVVDEDDPFGVGIAAAAQAIQASAKPEKGRLHKVVCPMCEQVGFVPKTAVGKPVRCANEKCMVPVFTATDPAEPTSARKPTRLSDEAEAARKVADASKPGKKNPLIIYGIVGGILLVLTIIVLPLLTKAPDTSDLNKPVTFDPTKFGPDDEETERLIKEKEARDRAAADALNPVVEAAAHTRRMISIARQPNLRDKAWARRMTGDLYLRQADLTLAAQEFNQLLVVDRSSSFYRMDPQLRRYWRAMAASDTETAKKALEDAFGELPTMPKTGRQGIDAALGLSAALVNEGKIDQAKQLIAVRQLDTTIPDNRDAIAATAWAFVAFRCRDASLESPAVMDSLLWINPLHLAVAVDLAVHERWAESIAWSKTASDARALTDALVAIAEVAGDRKASAEVMAMIESAISGSDAVSSLRVRGAVAAASKDGAKVDACMESLAQLSASTPVPFPTSSQLVQDDIRDRMNLVYQAIAVSEIVRAAVASGKKEQATAAMTRLLSDLSAVAPPTALVRGPVNQIAANEGAFRKQLATEWRVSDETTFGGMFRNYRRHLEQLARVAEDRRLLEILLLARVVRGGGVAAVEQALAYSAELKQDIFLDELSGLLAISARATGQPFPEVFSPDVSLRKGRAMFGNAALVVPVAAKADQAWASRDQNLTAGLTDLESGAGTDLPGIRQAFACELVESAAKGAQDPVYVLTAVSKMKNGIWREECYIISGRVFADRNLNKKAEGWMTGAKIPPMEQISLLYGISLGILERPVPTATSSGDTSAAEKKSGTGV